MKQHLSHAVLSGKPLGFVYESNYGMCMFLVEQHTWWEFCLCSSTPAKRLLLIWPACVCSRGQRLYTGLYVPNICVFSPLGQIVPPASPLLFSSSIDLSHSAFLSLFFSRELIHLRPLAGVHENPGDHLQSELAKEICGGTFRVRRCLIGYRIPLCGSGQLHK